jgi:hypothetical protein
MTHLDLLGLLRGELGNADALAAGAHLRECEECREELADLSVGHGLLGAAGRRLGHLPEEEALPELPPLRRTPALAGRAAARPAWAAALLAGAAAVLLLAAGVGLGRSLDEGGAPVANPRPTVTVTSSPAPAVGRTAALEPLQPGAAVSGTVSMLDEGGNVRMSFATVDLPPAGRHRFYYAWLLDPDTNKMLPLGQLDPGGSATFELPLSLVRRYSSVDISLERDDGDPQHSPTSVLRAAYG